MFLTFTYFTFYGMMVVGLTPTQHMAAVISSAFYSLWNLFSGFLIPKKVSVTFIMANATIISLCVFSMESKIYIVLWCRIIMDYYKMLVTFFYICEVLYDDTFKGQ